MDTHFFATLLLPHPLCYSIRMCSRGVYQLKKLSLFFCDWGGSSQGVRDLLTSKTLKEFINTHPHIEFEFIRKRNYHPYVSSTYINGYIKDVPLRALEAKEVLNQLTHSNNSCTLGMTQLAREA